MTAHHCDRRWWALPAIFSVLSLLFLFTGDASWLVYLGFLGFLGFLRREKMRPT
jgi:hypothetical protein